MICLNALTMVTHPGLISAKDPGEMLCYSFLSHSLLFVCRIGCDEGCAWQVSFLTALTMCCSHLSNYLFLVYFS